MLVRPDRLSTPSHVVVRGTAGQSRTTQQGCSFGRDPWAAAGRASLSSVGCTSVSRPLRRLHTPCARGLSQSARTMLAGARLASLRHVLSVFYRTHDRVRRLFRQSLAYEHAIQSLELVEAHACEWVQFTSQDRHLFEPIIPDPPPQPTELPAASAQPSVAELEGGSIVVGEAEGVDEELSPITTPTASVDDSFPNEVGV